MLNAARAGSALALTLAALYAVCLTFFVIWPQGFLVATAMLFHGSSMSITAHALSVSDVLGIFCIAILGYLVGAAYALIWNALASDRSTIQRQRTARR